MILKDYKRAERLNEVYKHLFANFGIKSKKEMADYMKIQRTGLSAALNGAAANLTDNLFKKICLAWPGVLIQWRAETKRNATQRTSGKASIAAAPFKRNRSTDYSGPLFGTSGETSVMINNDWGEPFVGEW